MNQNSFGIMYALLHSCNSFFIEYQILDESTKIKLRKVLKKAQIGLDTCLLHLFDTPPTD